jgi:hypothetical protein
MIETILGKAAAAGRVSTVERIKSAMVARVGWASPADQRGFGDRSTPGKPRESRKKRGFPATFCRVGYLGLGCVQNQPRPAQLAQKGRIPIQGYGIA